MPDPDSHTTVDEEFINIASGFIAFSNVSTCYIKDKHFAGWFGVSSSVCKEIWCLLQRHSQQTLQETKVRRIHLLYTLLFLRQYAGERVVANMVKRTEKTVRKWIWLVIPMLSNLPMVSTKKKSKYDPDYKY